MNTYVAKMTAVTDEEGWSNSYGRKWVFYVACPIRKSLWDTLWELPGSRWEVGTMDMWVGV